MSLLKPGGRILKDNDMSASVTVVLEVAHESLIGLQIKLVNNDAVGVITVAASNVSNENDTDAVDLVFKDGTSSAIIPSGDATPHYIDIETSAPYLFITYTRTSGTTGNLLNIYSHAKAG